MGGAAIGATARGAAATGAAAVGEAATVCYAYRMIDLSFIELHNSND